MCRLPDSTTTSSCPCGSPGLMPSGLSAGLMLRMADVPSRPSSPGSRKLQDHCWPTTSTSVASSGRSEEHTSELQSLMRISYAVFCLKKKKNTKQKSKESKSTQNNQL